MPTREFAFSADWGVVKAAVSKVYLSRRFRVINYISISYKTYLGLYIIYKHFPVFPRGNSPPWSFIDGRI